jgi:hypothetical protein
MKSCCFFSIESLDGRKCKSTIKVEGDKKFVQEQRDAATGTLATTITREINADGKFLQVIDFAIK